MMTIMITKKQKSYAKGDGCPVLIEELHDDSIRRRCSFSTKCSSTCASTVGANAVQILNSCTASPYLLKKKKANENEKSNQSKVKLETTGSWVLI